MLLFYHLYATLLYIDVIILAVAHKEFEAFIVNIAFDALEQTVLLANPLLLFEALL